MKKLSLVLLAGAFFAVSSFGSSGSISGTVVDAHGLDGCTFLIRLGDGTRLEPVNLPKEFQVGGLKVAVSYEPALGASICMAGALVRLTSIERLASTASMECPPAGWVDCMPPTQHYYCQPEVRRWVESNCPGVHYAD